MLEGIAFKIDMVSVKCVLLLSTTVPLLQCSILESSRYVICEIILFNLLILYFNPHYWLGFLRLQVQDLRQRNLLLELRSKFPWCYCLYFTCTFTIEINLQLTLMAAYAWQFRNQQESTYIHACSKIFTP